MKIHFLIITFILSLNSILAQSGPSFDQYFIKKTMRLDYFHTGTAMEELYSYDEIFEEPLWSGSIFNLLDTLNLGKYLFKVYDIETNELIYSRGFCSIFGEWQTTYEAKENIRRTFSESIRFPWPKKSIKVTMGARDQYNVFQEDWTFIIDPADPDIQKTSFFSDISVVKLIDNGDPNEKVDIVIIPDGYTSMEMDKLRRDTKHLLEILFFTSPFDERKQDFNVWVVNIPSNMTGIDDPQNNHYVDNILSCSYNSFGMDRYILTWDNKTVRKIAARAPYDQIIILINETKYGGGGIFNLYSICVSDNEWSGYIFVHEFGHAFGGLADEYYTSDVTYSDFYTIDIEPWEPNITVLLDRNHSKWQDLIEPGIPVPTPWNKEVYDQYEIEYNQLKQKMNSENAFQSKLDSLTIIHDQLIDDFLRNQTYWGKVGVFEGAGYASQGLYRPFVDCRMFTRSMTGFDPVCRRSIEKVIDFYID